MYPIQIATRRLVNRPTFGYGGHLGDIPTTIDAIGADISAAIQATTRPNQPAYVGNMVDVPASSVGIGAGAALGIIALIGLVLMSRRA